MALTVVGGFLGAGKTTLLNRMLSDAGGRRIAVLVNDFGAINIDAALVASSAGDAIALSNGCVCCSIGDDLSRALIQVLDAPQPFDAVVIEASGVSDPWKIAQIGLADPQLVLHGVFVLVDAAAVLSQAADPLLTDTLERQLRAADLVVLNKIDRVDAAQRRRVAEWIETVAGETPQFETEQARLPVQLLGELPLAGPGWPAHEDRSARGEHPHDPGHGGQHDHQHDHQHGHEHGHEHAELFESWALAPDAVLSAKALRALLKAMPGGVLRLKGLVRSDAHGWSELQFAGRHGTLRRAAPPAGDAGAQAAVVAIGLRGRLPRDALQRAFAQAALPAI